MWRVSRQIEIHCRVTTSPNWRIRKVFSRNNSYLFISVTVASAIFDIPHSKKIIQFTEIKDSKYFTQSSQSYTWGYSTSRVIKSRVENLNKQRLEICYINLGCLDSIFHAKFTLVKAWKTKLDAKKGEKFRLLTTKTAVRCQEVKYQAM